MARKAKYDWGKTSSSKYQKFETDLTFKFDLTHDTQETFFIDTAQCLSLINRKLVRQGNVFKISNMRVWSFDGDAEFRDFQVSALPRTWMMFNSYKKARSLWNQMNLEAIDALGSGNLPKYYDFKVYYDREHFDNEHNSDGGVLTANLLPVDQDGDAIATGDWVYSKYETSAATPLEMNIHMLGGHSADDGSLEGSAGRDLPNNGGSIGAILAYQQSRGAAFTDQDLAGLDQNIDIDSPWAQLFAGDTQMQEVLTDLDVDNDGPPYPADYAGGVEHPEGRAIAMTYIDGGDSGSYRPTRIPTFEAPLGLIKLDTNRRASSADIGDNSATTGVWMQMTAQQIGSC
jgi:hypothetical protein